MVKEKKILFNSFCYLLVGLLICLLGISNVFASTYNATQFTAQLYDNYGPSLTAVTTDFTNNRYQGIIPTMVANSSGAAWGISSPVTLVANHTYTLTAEITGTYGGNLVLSTYNRIGVGSTLNNAKNSYQNNSSVKEIYSKVQDNGITIQFAFTPTINASYIVFPFATNYSGDRQYFYLENIVIDDLGSESLTQEQITNSLNSQTNELNDSINNLGDEITGSIKDTFENCRDSYNLINPTFGGPYMNGLNVSKNSDGTINITGTPNQSWSNIAEDIQQTLTSGVYTFSLSQPLPFTIGLRYTNNNNNSVDFYIVAGSTSATQTLNGEFTLYKIYLENLDTSNNYNITNLGLQLQSGNVATKFEKPGDEICQNKIDETNDKLDNLQGSITDDNVSGSLNSAGSFFDNFTTTDHGGLSGIITAPLVAINQMLNTSCNPMTATFKGKELSLPCGYEFWNRLGAIQDFLNIVLGGLLCYRIIVQLYKLKEKIKNPEDDRLEVMDL